jgi:hypothetical protein
MVLFFTVLLGISLVGMGGLLALKRFEMTTGKVVLEDARPSIGAFFYSILVWVERDLPNLLHYLTGQGLKSGKKLIQRWLAQALLVLEHTLERVLRTLRSTTTPQASMGSGEVSAFLREVAEHKKKLLTRTSTTPEVQVEE